MSQRRNAQELIKSLPREMNKASKRNEDYFFKKEEEEKYRKEENERASGSSLC